MKFYIDKEVVSKNLSQPARAVWIEIAKVTAKEKALKRHSLRGLCGLKYTTGQLKHALNLVTACEGCVD